MAYMLIFLLEMWVAFAFFFQQKYMWIRYRPTKTLNILATNELVKLTML